jgi:hypothetical protein
MLEQFIVRAARRYELPLQELTPNLKRCRVVREPPLRHLQFSPRHLANHPEPVEG